MRNFEVPLRKKRPKHLTLIPITLGPPVVWLFLIGKGRSLHSPVKPYR